MRARISQAAAGVGWPLRAADPAAEADEHIALVLDESVGQNYELLRRGESSPRRSNSGGSGASSAGGSTPSSKGRHHHHHHHHSIPYNGGATHGNVSSSSSKYLAPDPPHGGGVASSSSSSSLSKLADHRDRDLEGAHYHGHRPSFRVIGVQISHLSRTGQFIFCTLGVFFFLLIYGFLQEYMVIHVFNRKLGIFLTLCQFAGYASLSALHRKIHADVPRRIPLGYYILLASLQASMQGLTNLSMRWLNYPAKMLFKSSRVIPTMAVGILYMKKRYKVKDYVVVALLSLGLVFFMQADVKVSPSFHPLGIIFICMALAVDAAIVNLQEFTLRKYDASHDELIFYSYGLGSLFLLAYCLLSFELYEGVVFLREAGAKATVLLVVFCSCGYFGVTCVAALTKKFGALASTMTTTARKALTLFLSFFIFPKPATAMHVVGGLLFVLGLTVKAVPSGGGGGGGKGGSGSGSGGHGSNSSGSSHSSSSSRGDRRAAAGGPAAAAAAAAGGSSTSSSRGGARAGAGKAAAAASRVALKSNQLRALLSSGGPAAKPLAAAGAAHMPPV